MTIVEIENARRHLRTLRVPDHYCTSENCKARNAALDLALILLQREHLVELLLSRQYSHFFHPDVTTAHAVQEAAEAVRDHNPQREHDHE